MELTRKNYREEKMKEIKRIGVVACEYGCLVIKVVPYQEGYELQVNRKENFEDHEHYRTYIGDYKTLEQAQEGALATLIELSRSYKTIKK